MSDDGAGSPRTASPRAVVLVAYLALHAGTPQPRQRIAGLFWPDSADAQALTNLRRELHGLRQALGDDPSLVVTARDLCWQDAATCRVDLRVFATERDAALAAAAAGDDRGVIEHATAAIAEYRGDLLPSTDDDWLLEARPDLRRQCVDLCDRLCAAQTRTGDLARAAAAVRLRLQLEPLEETGYRTLMQLQADLGDRSGAVSTYHHCASVLERELGVTPDVATRTLFQRLIAPPRPSAAAEGAGQAGGRAGPAVAPLITRSAEFGLLRDVWRAAVAARPGVALVSGGAGVGKTRLVAELAGLARAERAVVASTRCFGTSGRLALAPVADWLRAPAVQSAAATLDPAWRAEVGRLVPAHAHGAQPSGARAMADAWQRHRFFEGLARALHAVGRPTLLVLDDMQWCDQETMTFIEFCLALGGGARLLVAATARADGPGGDGGNPDLADWTVRMRAAGLLTELSLGPLEAAGTAQLARAVAGRPIADADAELLHATTGGFPLFVIEAVRGSADIRGAPSAADLPAVLRKRLEQATPPARELAGLAAAVGANFTLDLLTEASDLPAGQVVAAVDELWRLRIMREFGDGYDFSHDLLREAAYAGVSPPNRWLLHRRIAQGLELLHAEDTDAVAAQLADQYARGGRPERAAAYYRRAADVAAGRFAHADAIRLHRKALTVIGGMPAGRDRDSRELAVLEVMAAPLNAMHGYSSRELQAVLERSVQLAESLGRTESRVAGLTALWTSRFVQGRIADSYQIATSALRLIDPDSELSGPAHFAVGGSAVTLGMPASGLEHLQTVAERASGAVSLNIGTRADVHGTAWAAHACWLLGRDDDARSASRGAVQQARAIGHPYNLAVALAYSGISCQMRGDEAELTDTVAELRELCERYRFAYYREWALILDGWSRRPAPGADLARRGIANLRSAGSLARMPYWLSLLADVFARLGREQQARTTLDAAIATGHVHDDVWWLPEVLRMRAAYDDGPAAAERLRAAARMAAEHGSTGLLRRCERDLAALGVGVLPVV